MIDFINVSVGFGAQQVLRDVSFKISAGEHVGIVGPNGAGKSTILALLMNEMSPDRGEVSVMHGLRTGYLRQQITAGMFDGSLLDYVESASPEIHEMHREIESIEHALPNMQDRERELALRRLGELQTDFEHRGGYELSHTAQAALCGLGFDPDHLRNPFSSFSGGWQMRAELARAIIARPDLLLLDEPTNFLDIPAVEWLRKYLREFAGILLLISHDRYLLNSLTTITLEVNGGFVTRYGGNYDWYARERVQRYEQFDAARKNQQKRREQIERFIERFKAKNTFATQAQSRVKMLERMDKEEKEQGSLPPSAQKVVAFRLPHPAHSGQEVMRLENAGISYDGTHWVLKGLDLSIQRGEKTALVGLNGLGKTTLLRVMTGALPLSEGKRVVGKNVAIGYQAQDFAETMDTERTVLETARAANPRMPEGQVRTLLGGFLFSGDAVDKRVAVLSGGEKMRLAFVRLLINPPNFLLLDEPTTHLDIASCEALEKALMDYQGTICFVSHDIEFVRRIATGIIAMTPPIICRYPGGYDYFREKTGEAEQARQAVPKEKREDQRKVLRREKALKRQEQAKIRKPLEKKIHAAEHAIATLEKEQSELAAKLSNPSMSTDYAGINQRLKEVHAEINSYTAEWEEAGVELEKLKNPDNAEQED